MLDHIDVDRQRRGPPACGRQPQVGVLASGPDVLRANLDAPGADYRYAADGVLVVIADASRIRLHNIYYTTCEWSLRVGAVVHPVREMTLVGEDPRVVVHPRTVLAFPSLAGEVPS